MKLQKLIGVGQVFVDLEAADGRRALQAVVERMAADLSQPAAEVVRALRERELLGSTSVGAGFAIPHCKLRGLGEIVVSLARFTGGVDFNAPDGEPVVFFFVVLSPPDQPAAHLQVLSQIARVLKRQDLRSDLLRVADAEAVVDAIRRVAEAEGL